MLLELLPTKLNIPAIRPSIVSRPRLLNKLNYGLDVEAKAFSNRLSLISAPAGFGKSTLVIDWIQHLKQKSNFAICWLSLEEKDNNLGRFLSYLAAALQKANPAWGQAMSKMLRASDSLSSPALIGSLIRDLSLTPDQPRIVLVLDDFHTVTTRAIHDALTFLVDHQPPNLHLVVITREDPLMPLARLRARGQMVEVRLDDLRFTLEETAAFLGDVTGLSLNSADVAALESRTEGWIAGLQLAALSMKQSENVTEFIRSFTGSSRYLLDYLIEEVITKQSDSVQTFLLQTSILSRFCASLCDAVTDQKDGAEQLTRLQQANLFVVGLDDEGQWFRYHHLFAELLRHRQQLSRLDSAVLHRRAGEWFISQGFPDEAIPHFLAARAWPEAAEALAIVSEGMLRRGEATTLLSWLAQLPSDLFEAQLPLALQYVWALIMTGRLDLAESHLESLDARVQEVPQLRVEALVAQAYLARMRFDVPRTIALSRQALALLPPDQVGHRSVLSVNLGIAHWHAAQLAEAERTLTEARYTAEQARNHYAKNMAVGFLALVQGAQARLVQASELLRQVLANGTNNPTEALMHRVLGALLYEWNDLEGAAQHLAQAERWAEAIGNAELLTGILRGSALLRQAQGDSAGAVRVLARLHALSAQHRLPAYTLAGNAAVHVQVALAQNDMATAVHWAGMVSEPADGSPFFPRLNLTPARLLLAQEEKTAAGLQLEPLYTQAQAAECTWGMIEVRTMQALAATGTKEAQTFLSEALTLGQPARLLRTFTDKGPLMAALLQQAILPNGLATYAREILSSFSPAAAGLSPALDPPGSAATALVEPLSERELEILQLLAEGCTNAEIAQALVLSVNTVKTHLQHIYEKLGVHDRRTAVARARILRLLSSEKAFPSPG